MQYLNEESKNKNADFIWMANIASQLIGAASVPEDSEAGFRPSRKECDERLWQERGSVVDSWYLPSLEYKHNRCTTVDICVLWISPGIRFNFFGQIVLSLGTQCPRYQKYNVCPSLPVRVITKIKLANPESLLQVYVIIEKELVPHSGKNVSLAARRPQLESLNMQAGLPTYATHFFQFLELYKSKLIEDNFYVSREDDNGGSVIITELGNNFTEKNSIFLNGNRVLTNPSCEVNSMIWFKADVTRLFWVKLIFLNNMLT